MMHESLRKLLDDFAESAEKRQGEKRQDGELYGGEPQLPSIHAALENTPAAEMPLLFWRPQNTGIPGSTYTLKEQFYDKAKMLHGQLEDVLVSAAENFGAPLCIRPNFGTIFLPAALGLEYAVFDDAYPWLTTHLTRAGIVSSALDKAVESPMMQRAVEYISWFRELLPPEIHVYMPDTQGPFDLAHLIYGDQLFLDMYDDPQFVHELLQFCTELYISCTLTLKKALGEPEGSCYHGHALIQGIHLNNGGVRISEDTATLISPEQIDEYVIPYDKQALDRFGGGFIHYCGKNDHLLDAYLALEGVRAINFGNPEMHDFSRTMEKFKTSGVCCFGKWPVTPGETPREYFRRIGRVTDGGSGIILHLDSTAFSGSIPAPTPRELFELSRTELSEYRNEDRQGPMAMKTEKPKNSENLENSAGENHATENPAVSSGQLRNHIPLAGPATREPCDGTEGRLRVSLGFTPRWYHDRLGIDFGEIWHTDPVYRYESLVTMKEYLHAHFPSVPYFTPRYENGIEPACATISGVYGILLIPMIYGAEPLYASDAWPDAKPILTLDDIRNLPPPSVTLDANNTLLQLEGQMEIISEKWGPVHGYLNYQGIINIAAKLRGSELFLDMLDEPETVKNFFRHIAGTIEQVSKKVQRRQRESGFFVDLLSMSNCTVSMISPQQYEEFILPLDMHLSTQYQRFGIHTCNWVADPYLDSLRKIDKMGYLDTGIRSNLTRIKRMFPETRRALLLTPGEVEAMSDAELSAAVKRINLEYAPCDIVLADVETTMPDERINEFLAIVREEENLREEGERVSQDEEQALQDKERDL